MKQTYNVDQIEEMLRKLPKIGDGFVHLLSEDLRFNSPAIAQQLLDFMELSGVQQGRINALVEELSSLRAKLDIVGESLKSAKWDLDNCSWECSTCNKDYGMDETDLYYTIKEALSQIQGSEE